MGRGQLRRAGQRRAQRRAQRSTTPAAAKPACRWQPSNWANCPNVARLCSASAAAAEPAEDLPKGERAPVAFTKAPWEWGAREPRVPGAAAAALVVAAAAVGGAEGQRHSVWCMRARLFGSGQMARPRMRVFSQRPGRARGKGGPPTVKGMCCAELSSSCPPSSTSTAGVRRTHCPRDPRGSHVPRPRLRRG